jgi:hypothetical protein
MCVLLPLLLLQPFFRVTNPKCAILVLGVTYYFVKPSQFLFSTIHKYTLLEPTFYDFASHYIVPKILPLPLAQAKNGGKEFWKEKFHGVSGKA